MTDKYKDPVNIKILDDLSKHIESFRREIKKTNKDDIPEPIVSYRIGIYSGMNIVLKNLGREPL